MIDDSVFTIASTTATPLQVEKAKSAALAKQLSRSLEDKKQLQTILSKTQESLCRVPWCVQYEVLVTWLFI